MEAADQAAALTDVERIARYVKARPRSVWKPVHTRFIDAQFAKARAFYARLAQQPGGKERLARLRKLRRKGSGTET